MAPVPSRLTPLLLLIGTLLNCGKPPDAPITIRILEAGVAQPVGEQERKASAGSATGFVTRGDAVIQGKGTTVPAARDTTFGFSYRLDGLRRGQALRITQVVRHPPMKKPDGSIIEEQVSYEDLVGDGGPVEGRFWYILREQHEVVPGIWTVSLKNGTTTLVTQQFTVVPVS